MPQFVEFTVHYCKKADASGKCIERGETSERVESQEVPEMKLQLGRLVRSLRSRGYVYFYVVLKARKSDGSFGYRTVVPKTLLT